MTNRSKTVNLLRRCWPGTQPCGTGGLAVCLWLCWAGWLLAATLPTTAQRAKPQAPPPRLASLPTVDVGDGYLTPTGRRALHRLVDVVAVRAATGTNIDAVMKELGRPRMVLTDWTVAWEVGRGYRLLRRAHRQSAAPVEAATELNHNLKAIRQLPGLAAANPVFVDPQDRLWLVPTSEIIVCLRPGTDPQRYFGADWPRARRLAGGSDTFVLTLPSANAEELLAEVNRRMTDPQVAWAEPNFISQVRRQTNDRYYRFQWHLKNTGQTGGRSGADLDVLEAWQVTTGRADIVVALLDDGVQLDHPDLSANLFVNAAEDGFDSDWNGYVGDRHGWDFFDADHDPSPADLYDDHGTATAGVVASVGNNKLGGVGVAFGCRIMPVKVIRGDWAVAAADMAEAIYYAAGRDYYGGWWRGADVLSISLAFAESRVVSEALGWAARSGRGGYGCPIFAASGNSASRWQVSRFEVPVGRAVGPGWFRIGFEYRKDSLGSEGEDLVMIDNVALVRGDGLTLVNSALGPGGRQDFEGNTFPPPGWVTDASPGSEPWTVTTNRALTGTGGKQSARSGYVRHGGWSELRTPLIALAGDEILSFSCYTSSELEDGLYVWVYDPTDGMVWVYPELSELPLASGNPDIITAIEFPARHPDVIAVGASTDADLRADYSQFGLGLDFLAPSSGGWSDIITTDRTGTDGYAYDPFAPTLDYDLHFGGTSAAAPAAAGVGALLLSANPLLTASEVRALMRDSCVKIGKVTYTNGWHPLYGYGRLDAGEALRRATPDLQVKLYDFPDPVALGQLLRCTVTVTNHGQAVARDVILTCFFPTNAQFVSASVPQSWREGLLDLLLGDLASGSGLVIEYLLQPVSGSRLTNAVEATSYALDLNPADNQATVTTQVRGPDTQRPSLSISFPPPGARLTNMHLSVKGTATDNAGVARIDYWVENLAGLGPVHSIFNSTITGPLGWSGPLIGLVPGTNVIRARAWDASDNPAAEVARQFFIAVSSPLRVLVRGQGTLSPPGTNRLLTLHTTHSIQARPAWPGYLFSNWVGRLGEDGPVLFVSGQPQMRFFMVSNLVLEANFVANPFLGWVGSFNGLFYESGGVTHDRSGAFSLALRASGTYSASMQVAGQRLSMSGQFDLNGRATNRLVRRTGDDLYVEWQLNIGGTGTNDLWGWVRSADGAWTAELVGDRVPVYAPGASPYAGRYTLLLSGTHEPGDTTRPTGDSPAVALVNNAGRLSLVGTLADNRPMSLSAQVNTNGLWPLYASLYGGRGSILAWAGLPETPAWPTNLAQAPLSWIKPATTDRYHPGPFQLETVLLVSCYRFSRPVLQLSNAPVVLLGGNLAEPLTNCITVLSNNAFLPCGPLSLTLKLNGADGRLTGTLNYQGRRLPLQGVVLQSLTNGAGFFLGTNQSGWFGFGP